MDYIKEENLKVFVRIRPSISLGPDLSNQRSIQKPKIGKSVPYSKKCVSLEENDSHIGQTVKIKNINSYSDESKSFAFQKVSPTYDHNLNSLA